MREFITFMVYFCALINTFTIKIFYNKKTWATGLTSKYLDMRRFKMKSQNLDIFPGYFDIYYDNPKTFEKWKHLKSNLPVCILAVKFD